VRYLVNRILQSILLLWLSTVAVFGLVHAMPGGVLAAFANNPMLTEAAKKALIRDLGLDRPLITQYFSWLGAVLQGDLGRSYNTGQQVIRLIGAHLPPTLELSFASFAFALVLSLVIGVVSATRRFSWLDYALTFLAYLGVSMPVFWFAVMLILVFSITWPIFPVQGYNNLSNPSLLSNLHHLVLPAITLTVFFVARWSRYVRANVLEVLGQDYVRTAHAKGQTRSKVIVRHVLRNALIPFVTVFALDVGSVIGGATITETIFAWPGMGRLFYDSLTYRDYPVIMGILLISAAVVIVANLLADLAYTVLDPRIQLA
jgi:peptide/nickel transport system permease protein